MPRFAIAVISLVAGTTLIVAVWLANRQVSAAVYVSPAVQLLGSVDPDAKDEVTAAFRLHNSTSRPLGITKTMTSCACTDLSVAGSVVPSGGVADLTMRIRTKGLRGHQRITAQIWTDNAEYPQFELAATADFTAGDAVSPFSVTLPPVTPGEKLHYEFDISGLHAESISADLLFETVKVTFTNTKQEGNPSSTLVFDGAAPPATGNYPAKFSALFQGISEPVDVNVYLNIVDRLEASPTGINFGVVGRNSEVDRAVRIVDRRSLGISAVNLVSNSQGIQLYDVAMVDGTARLKLRFNASAPEEFIDEQLRLSVTLRDGTVETLELPIRARIIVASP